MSTDGTERPLERIVRRSQTIHNELATCHPKLSRGMVWCHKCGREQKVNSAECFRRGWPLCCGQTMSIDSPEERAALSSNKE